MSNSLSRRAALGALGGVTLLAGAPRRASAAGVPLTVSIIPIFDVAHVYAAQQQGFFSAEGLDVTIETVQSGSVELAGLVGGSFDVSYVNPISVMLALQRGIDVQVLAQGAPVPHKPPAPSAIFRRHGDAIRSGKDLEGKIIGVTALRDIEWMISRSWVHATGGDPDTVSFREIPAPAAIEALKTHQMDAGLIVDPFLTMASGDPSVELVDWAAVRVFAGGPTSWWITRGDLASTKLPQLRGFLRASQRGAAWMEANRNTPAFYAVIASFTKLDPAIVEKMNRVPVMLGVMPQQIEILIRTMRANGMLSANITPKILAL